MFFSYPIIRLIHVEVSFAKAGQKFSKLMLNWFQCDSKASVDLLSFSRMTLSEFTLLIYVRRWILKHSLREKVAAIFSLL